MALAMGCAEPPRSGGPNLVLVTIDTLRADVLACYCGEPDVGRALCGLAKQGTRYEQAFSPAPSTGPSIASLLTSSYPHAHRISQFATTQLASSAVSVAQVLSGAGYATAAFIGNPVLDASRGFDRGFDVYDAEMTGSESNRAVAEREARALTEAALAWVESAPAPWFLWVHYQDPHGPYAPPAGSARIARAGHELPLLRHHSGKGGIPAYQALPGVEGFDAYLERYRGEIRYLDLHAGILLAELDRIGDRPGVILTSDHGEALGEDDYYFAHGHSVGLDQLRVPLLWRPPGGGEARSVARAVSTIDVAPTLIEAAGLRVPDAYTGVPLTGAEASGDRAIYAQHRARAAVLSGSVYYARDRIDLGGGVPDAISGGVLEALPARRASIGPVCGASLYRAAADDDELGVLLDAHLERAGPTPPLGADLVDPASVEALRALGYLR